MELEHEFTVPVPAEDAWRVLLDIERVAPCMPGATLEAVEGEEFRGRVKVKVGPIQVTYNGTARFVEKDDAKHLAVIEARGKEARGSGTAAMTVTAQLHEQNGSTRVTAVTDLAITGRPAQFGRGVLAEVGGKIIGRFADCLATQLGSGAAQSEEAPESAAATAAATAAAADETPAPITAPVPEVGEAVQAAVPPVVAEKPPPQVTATPQRPTSDTIDLFDTAGVPILKRLAPVLAALAALTVILVGWRRARRHR
jgi:carbon monoxide dehydrogenase subunit G